MSSRIQQGLSPRVATIYSITEQYRQYVHTQECYGIILLKEYSKPLRYFSGPSQTSYWLNLESENDIKGLNEEMRNAGFIEIWKESDLRGEKKTIQESKDITQRYKPFQNLINELNNVINVSRYLDNLDGILPLEKRRQIYFVAKHKDQNLFMRLLRPKPDIDEKSNMQKFDVRLSQDETNED